MIDRTHASESLISRILGWIRFAFFSAVAPIYLFKRKGKKPIEIFFSNNVRLTINPLGSFGPLGTYPIPARMVIVNPSHEERAYVFSYPSVLLHISNLSLLLFLLSSKANSHFLCNYSYEYMQSSIKENLNKPPPRTPVRILQSFFRYIDCFFFPPIEQTIGPEGCSGSIGRGAREGNTSVFLFFLAWLRVNNLCRELR